MKKQQPLVQRIKDLFAEYDGWRAAADPGDANSKVLSAEQVDAGSGLPKLRLPDPLKVDRLPDLRQGIPAMRDPIEQTPPLDLSVLPGLDVDWKAINAARPYLTKLPVLQFPPDMMPSIGGSSTDEAGETDLDDPGDFKSPPPPKMNFLKI